MLVWLSIYVFIFLFMQHITKCVLSIGILCAIWGYQTLSAYDEASSNPWFQWNYGTLENPIYTFASQLPAFIGSWNYGTLDMPVWFSFGSFEDNSSSINVGVITSNSISENSSSSLQKEEIIDNASNPTYSPDGKSFAYVVWDNDGTYFIMKDGVKYSKYKDISHLTYSLDGKSFAYIAKKMNDEHIIVKDWIESSEYTGITDLTYSPDWKSFAYVAWDNQKAFVVKDGIAFPKHSNVWKLTYSPDWTNLVYSVYDYSTDNDGVAYFFIKDGVESLKYKNAWSPTYSPDGRSLAYVAKVDGKFIVVKDDVISQKYDDINYQTLTYSPDGRSLAYVAKADGKFIVVKDGVSSQKYDFVSNLMYSPDGKSFVYLVQTNNKQLLIKDGVEFTNSGFVSHFAYSPDGTSFAYDYFEKISNSKSVVVKDGVESRQYDVVNGITYSPDGKSIAYSVQMNGVLSIIKQNFSEWVVDLGNSSQETVIRKILDIDSFELDPQVKLATYTKKEYNYSYSFPIATFYQWFVAPTWVTHEMVLKSSAPPTSRIDGDIVVDFYQWRILPELQWDDFVQIENRFYIVKWDSTFVIEDRGNNQQSKNIRDAIIASAKYQK